MKHQTQAPTHLTPAPATETHIHHEEPTILARWLQRGMAQGPIFWIGVVGLMAALAVVVYLTGGRAQVRSGGQAAWTELAAIGQDPTTAMFGTLSSEVPAQLQELAASHPNSTAATWARIQAASILLREASADLATSKRTDAIGKLLEADEAFQAVLTGTTDPIARRVAALGAARAAEARLGLSLEDANRPKPTEVLGLYEKVAADFPGTPEAQRAQDLARRLADPDAVTFYERLAKFDPDAITIPPPGFPGSIPGLTPSLAPGASSPLMDLFNTPGSTIPPAPTLPAPTNDALPPAVTPLDEPAAPTPPASEPAPAETPSEPAVSEVLPESPFPG